MPGGATFAELLERELAAFRRRGSVSASSPAPPPAYRRPHPFLFAKLQFSVTPFKATVYGAMSRAAGASRVTRLLGPAPPSRRPRQLTLHQQSALRALVGLGVSLAPDFTATELRHAYWTLARRYHPDRHPGCGEAEKARLARVFADMNESHRRLLAALRESAPARP